MLPLVKEVAGLFQQNAEEDGLTPKLRTWTYRYNVKSWAEAYEDPANYASLHVGAMLVQEETQEALQRISPSDLTTPEGVQAWIDDIYALLEQYIDEDSDGFDFMEAEEPQVWEEAGSSACKGNSGFIWK